MVAVRYAPGQAHLVATRATVVLIDADIATDLLTRIWRQVDEGRGLAAVLEALTGAFGTSLVAIPPFVVAVAEPDGLRVAVRGDITVTALGGDAPARLTGVGVTTWSERVLSGITRTEIQLSAPGDGGDVRLPLRDGVVRASAVTVDWTHEDAAADRSEPVPAVTATVPVPAVPEEPAPAAVQEPVAEEPEPEAEPEESEPKPAEGTEPSLDTWVPADATLIPEITGIPFDLAPTPPHGVPAADTPDATDVADTVASVRVRGDHDGETVSVAQARALRGAATAEDPAHEPLAPPRPTAPGRLRLSTGQLVALDRTVVIGRRPRSTRVTGTDLPHLIAVESPEQDISRSHLEVRVEGDSILATDLHTTNGTTLRRIGADPVRLHPGERNVVVPGDVLDLGDGITVTVEDIA
nr:FHA domain-containing protein [Microbacterium bovistercoris]